jgi:hypothetical protein
LTLVGNSAKEFSNAEIYPPAGYVIGMFVMSIFLAFRYRDVRLWFPAPLPKQAKAPGGVPALNETKP